MIKGNFVAGSGKKQLKTKNFIYTLTGEATFPVVAEADKGVYSGAKIKFTGERFICDASGASAGEGQKACDVWGEITWNDDMEN